MIARLDSICAASRNPFCNSPIAASITGRKAGRSSRVATRLTKSTLPRASGQLGIGVLAKVTLSRLPDDRQIKLVHVDRVLPVDPQIRRPELELPRPRVDQPPVLVVGLIGERR